MAISSPIPKESHRFLLHYLHTRTFHLFDCSIFQWYFNFLMQLFEVIQKLLKMLPLQAYRYFILNIKVFVSAIISKIPWDKVMIK
jgi:hypothetical protein